MTEKTKIVTLEGTSVLNNKELAAKIESAISSHLMDAEFCLTQKPRVQVAQPAKSKSKRETSRGKV